VAWRAWAHGDGIAVLHQLADTRPVPIEPDDLATNDLPYGGGGGCQPGIASAALTVMEGGMASTMPMPQARLAVDAAVSPSGDWVALAMPGTAEGEPTVGVT